MDRGESVDPATTQGRIQNFQKRGRGGGGGAAHYERRRRKIPMEIWRILPQKVLKISVSEMTISSILRQISYSFNRIRDVFVKK